MPTTAANSIANRWLLLYGIILLCGICLACGLGRLGFPCPRGDDAMYKSPAAELAQHGRLAIPCALGFLPQAEAVFANYPPVYQLVLSVWYLVFGVSLRSSLAFDYTVHLLGTAAVMEITRRLLRTGESISVGLSPFAPRKPRSFAERKATLISAPVLSYDMAASPRSVAQEATPLAPGVAIAITAGVGLLHLANVGYFDRPEELGLLWVWLELLTAARAGRMGWLRSGLCVGMAGLTSPWVGVLGLMTVCLRTLLGNGTIPFQSVIRRGLRCAMVAGTALSLAAAWYAVMESQFPGAVHAQFSAAAGYLKDAQLSEKVGDRLWIFFYTVMYRPAQLPAAAAIIVFFPLALAAGIRSARNPLGLSLYVAGVVGVLAVAAFRPIAYTYLGASLVLLLPCLAPALSRYCRGPGASARVGFVMLILCTIVGWKDVALMSASAWQTPPAQRPDRVMQRLTAAIPPGEPVAVLALHWHWFQGRNPWREAHFSSLVDPREVLECRWLVLSPGLGKPKFIDAFEQVDEIASAQDPARCYGYTLWRRREQPAQRSLTDAGNLTTP